jgi:F0F1-type ATP synthase alpha subunit
MYFAKVLKNIGIVESVSDGIINIVGLQEASNGEIVEILFAHLIDDQLRTQKALILNLGHK